MSPDGSSYMRRVEKHFKQDLVLVISGFPDCVLRQVFDLTGEYNVLETGHVFVFR
jgi:hypothetical protein